jgi:hypothetical protein
MIDCSSKSFIPKGAVAIYRAAPFYTPIGSTGSKAPRNGFPAGVSEDYGCLEAVWRDELASRKGRGTITDPDREG